MCQNNDKESLKVKLASAKEDITRVNVLNDLGRLYTFNYPDTAVSYGTQGLQLAQKAGYKSGEAISLSILCLSSTLLANYTSALGFGLKALPIFEELHDTASIVWTNIQIMNCYLQLEDYDQALVHGYHAKHLFRFSHPDANQISVGMGVIGSIYEKKNQLDSALYFLNALADEYLRLSYHGLRAKDKDFNADFQSNFDESIGKIEVVPQDIGRVLLNLYNNAFYAVNEKKKQLNRTFEPIVKVSTKKVDNKVEISVKDNGIGIPQKVVDKIFQPFFTTKPTGQGTGLGLSLSYDIIKAHGGEIIVETKEKEGTTFILKIPTA